MRHWECYAKPAMLSRRSLLALIPLVVFAGCQTPFKESDKKREDAKKNATGDPAFEAFLGRLRIAVQKKDYAMLQQMMAPSFGYRWDETQLGDSVFTYWGMHNTWPIISSVLRQPFAPLAAEGGESFMVATEDRPEGRYAAGMKMVGGAWRFVYFMPPAPPEEAAQ